MILKSAFLAIMLTFFFTEKEQKKHLLYKCTTSYDRYDPGSTISEMDESPFAGTVLDTVRSTDLLNDHYEQFRVYCDSTMRDGENYYWGVQVRSCTYTSRQAKFLLGTSVMDQPYALGERVAQSYCRITSFGSMLPIPPITEHIWLRVEGMDLARHN